MFRHMMLTLRAMTLGVLFLAVPFAAHAQESDPGGQGNDVGVEVEITPTATAEPTVSTAAPTAPTGPTTDPTDPTVPATEDATTPAADGQLGQTGFGGLPVLLAAGALIAVGGAILYRRRRTA